MMSGLDFERVVLAAGPVGIMQACLDVVLPYVRQQTTIWSPRWRVSAYAGKDCRHVYFLQFLEIFQDCAGLILSTSEKATQVALQAIQCLGGNGYMNEYPTARLLRDAKVYEIVAGTNEIRRMIVGREVFREK